MTTRNAPLQAGSYLQQTPTQIPAVVNQRVDVGQPQLTTVGGNTVGTTTGSVAPVGWDNPTSWCLPFIIYVILAIIGFIVLLTNLFSASNTMSTGSKWVSLIIWLIILAFFGWLIYYLCKKGHHGWAWFVLFLPLILLFVFWLFIVGMLGFLWADGGLRPTTPVTPVTPAE